MIYQFEHKKIKRCEDCKSCDLNFDWCNMQRCLIDKYQSPKFNNCPLVAISKTETTSCEWCELEPSEKIFAYGMGFRKMPLNYCPNCGRRLGK